jgi:AcrR family transcriptional regulator
MITRERAVAAALDVIDRVGLERFSVEAVGRELNVKPPSLYHHFKGRDDLLAHVAAYLTMSTQYPPDMPLEDWKEWLIELGVNHTRSLARHPKAAMLVIQYLPRPLLLKGYERAARLMSDAGVPPELHLLIITGMERLAYAVFAEELTDLHAEHAVFAAADHRWQYPALHQAIEHAPWRTNEELLRQVIRTFLDGVENLRPMLARSADGQAADRP